MHASPDPPQEQLDHLIATYDQGLFESVLETAQALAAEYPQSATLQNILGVANAQLHRVDDAITCYRRALQLKPDFAAAYNNLGNMQLGKGLSKLAAHNFRIALEIKPKFAAAHNNLGNALKAAGNPEEAMESYKRAIQLKPDYAEAYYNLGIALPPDALGQAIASLKKAIALKPDYTEAWENLGHLLADDGACEAAVACYRRALEIRPDLENTLADKFIQQAYMCDWSLWGEFASVAETIGLKDVGVFPFPFFSLEDDPVRHRLRAENFVRKRIKQAPVPGPGKPKRRPKRLRIGYFSCDFREHPVASLVAKLFKIHDRKSFQIFAYSFYRGTGDSVRENISRSADVFRDVKDKTDREIVDLARQDGIDIAIDLQGYTGKPRSEIFALRAAPVQISYLGYPGTMGADFIEYIVADEVVVPIDQQEHYSENIIYLPHSYMVTDDSKAISKRKASRAAFGLPDDAFVFCCFNATHKISPREFDIWMRLLSKVDGSVLWLKSSRWANANLSREAEARGVRSARIIFADRLELHEEHLARYRLADLFLDTFNYNAHATACDALWAGLPIVAKAGRSFSARVSASLLTAVGLPELVTETEEQYEALVLDLATHHGKLDAVRGKLARNLHTEPLFDTELFAKHIEDAYKQAYELYFLGEGPRTISVTPRSINADRQPARSPAD